MYIGIINAKNDDNDTMHIYTRGRAGRQAMEMTRERAREIYIIDLNENRLCCAICNIRLFYSVYHLNLSHILFRWAAVRCDVLCVCC